MITSNTNLEDFLKTQYALCVETIRNQYTLLVQLITVFLIANVTIVGFVFEKGASINYLYIGSLCPLFGLLTNRRTTKFLIPTIQTMLNIESYFKDEKVEFNYLASFTMQNFFNKKDRNMELPKNQTELSIILKKSHIGISPLMQLIFGVLWISQIIYPIAMNICLK